MKIRSIAGSLRARSVSKAALEAAGQLAPEGVQLQPLSIAELPLYNADIDVEGGPAAVVEFKAAIAEADGLIIATPEYNYGIPGALKNALDWASRPAYRSVLAGRPVAVIGVAGGFVGGARAVGQLKQVLGGTVSDVFPYPELLIGESHRKVDDAMTLTDEPTRDRLQRMVAEFARWVAARRAGSPLRAAG
ncbi:MAG: NADPH-dependent FMN reductase [Myxococcota bacterium]